MGIQGGLLLNLLVIDGVEAIIKGCCSTVKAQRRLICLDLSSPGLFAFIGQKDFINGLGSW